MFVEYCFNPICDTHIANADDVAKFLSHLYSGFSCYATQSSNPFRQASLLIDIKTHEKVPEFIEDVRGIVGHSPTLFSHVQVAITVQRLFPGLPVVLKLFQLKERKRKLHTRNQNFLHTTRNSIQAFYRVKIIVIGW